MASSSTGILILSGGFLGASLLKTISAKFEGLEEIFVLDTSSAIISEEDNDLPTGVTALDEESAIAGLENIRAVILNPDKDLHIIERIIDGASQSGTFVLLLSSTAPSNELVELEQQVRAASAKHCIFKLPLFYEDYLLFAEDIIRAGQLPTTLDNDHQEHRILADDVSKAVVFALRKNSPLRSCVHALFGECISPRQAADTFSSQLQKSVATTPISVGDFQKRLEDVYPSQLQVRRVLDLKNFARADSKDTVQFTDYEDLLGRKATSFELWTEAIAHKLKAL
eukprot:Plantae.Rhodophyta-Purpureofilum_apyrenoidigerum.ctg4406.p1 GENE.Plantae.Rhodophyta-Purpureofilum_apyrenoidigerum.ctg4406~~Plantae.Rhodophyta-Purpureofilum_apyrenoidigerum.ctg4406.p1  ORF type:complete len:283 (-),score=58.48 Plantae.Rhodophyta-Purpureofilum_apyrenoidigerum.ctg4406:716-1564(-)